MDFRAQVAKDMAAMMSGIGLAEDITYDGVAIKAIPVISEDNLKGSTWANTGRYATAYFWISAADVPMVVPGKKIVHNGVNWKVARLYSTDGITHYVLCTGKESAL